MKTSSAKAKGIKPRVAPKDVIGNRYGRLVVSSELSERGPQRRRMFSCSCDCGNEVVVAMNSLRSGNTESCGCKKVLSMRSKRVWKGETQPERDREKRLFNSFNLTTELYERILRFQGGVCAITGKISPRFVVDHDHKTGLVRGILDWRINRAIGHFKDNPELLRMAADYLENPTAPRALGVIPYGVLGSVSIKTKNRRYGPHRTKLPKPLVDFDVLISHQQSLRLKEMEQQKVNATDAT